MKNIMQTSEFTQNMYFYQHQEIVLNFWKSSIILIKKYVSIVT